MTTTPWKMIGPNERMRVSYGMEKLGEQEPYFSITGETEERRSARGKWREASGGQLHDMIRKHFTELNRLLKWHLVFKESGPMHYEANAIYHLKEGNLQYFKDTVIFGAVKGDDRAWGAVKNGADLRAFLRGRLPDLMSAFNRDMKKFGVN